jgi:hypothetical protein
MHFVTTTTAATLTIFPTIVSTAACTVTITTIHSTG